MTQALVHHFRARGAALEAMNSRAPEVLLAGPAGTGKSRAILEKLHLICLLSPNVRVLIVRKTLESLKTSALVTWERDVIKEAKLDGTVTYYGGSVREPAQYRYHGEKCQGSMVAMAGLDKPDKVMSTEWDCVVGGTLVDSPSEIQRAYSRPYSGRLVTIRTASGAHLTGTPNHPVFTTNGWVALGLLGKGDHVIRRCIADAPVVSARGPDVADQPTSIAEVAGALALASAGGTKRVIAGRMDFHGDVTHSYVDVVTTDRHLQRSLSTAGDEHLLKLDGQRRDLQQPALMGSGSSSERLIGSLATLVSDASLPTDLRHALAVGVGIDPSLTPSLGSSRELALPVGVGVADMPQGLPLTWGAGAEAALRHHGLESGRADVDQFGGFAEPEFPFEVAPDRIDQVILTDAGADCHVYNLQTDNHWYIANEIVSHNCIYVQEAAELEDEDGWLALSSRLRNGAISFQQLIADCNPSHPLHWLKVRCDEGKTLMLHSKHEDNPRYFDDQGRVTRSGQDYMARLDALTGVRRLRLRDGIWAAAEGVIYEEWDHSIHVVKRFAPPVHWDRIWSIDFGFVHPFVWQEWVVDPDGRATLYREIYHSRRLVEDHARQIRALKGLGPIERDDSGEFRARPYAGPPVAEHDRVLPRAIVADHDAEDRATLERHLGMGTTPANKVVSEGIQAVAGRLRTDGTGRPRLTIMEDARVERDQALADARKPTCSLEEVGGYVWEDKRIKEQPHKDMDDGMDAWRYAVAELDLHGVTRVRWA